MLDPAGLPLAGAKVVVVARPRGARIGGAFKRKDPAQVGATESDRAGRYELQVPRTASARQEQVAVLAGAAGFGIGWAGLDPDDGRPTADIRLAPERIIRGRLIDLHGRPVEGAEVAVISIGAAVHGAPQGLLGDWLEPREMPLWPRPAITDAAGRYAVRGIAPGLPVVLGVNDLRFAQQRFRMDADDTPAKEHVQALEPARIVAGHVTCADTGEAVPHALLVVAATRERHGVPATSTFRADDRGRFRINPASGNFYEVEAQPAAGSPYLRAVKVLAWPKGAVEQAVNLRLPRGTLLRGTVIEAGSGTPIEGADVEYLPLKAGAGPDEAIRRFGVTLSGSDGTFQMAVVPRPGHLVVRGPSDEYVYQVTGTDRIATGRGGGSRFYAHGIVAHDPGAGDSGHGPVVALRRGLTVKGTAVGPDGRPVARARVASVALIPPLARGWVGSYQGTVNGGHFALHGLAPDRAVRVFFLDPVNKWGAAVDLSGKSAAGGPITVRLQRCGTATMRLVDPAGDPADGLTMMGSICLVATPGPPPGQLRDPGDERLSADETSLFAFDRENHRAGLTSDKRGRLTLSALIPGATYRIYDHSTVNGPAGVQLRREFTVEPGEALDLGDIRITDPSFLKP